MWPKPVPGSATRDRRRRAATHRIDETAAMVAARTRDARCRFPWCGCGSWRTEVAHLRHRGMGGNPSGDRTRTSGLILLCYRRHQGPRFSLHSGAFRVRPLTDKGTDGPVAFEASLVALERLGLVCGERRDWFVVASEVAPGALAPVGGWEARALGLLRRKSALP